jgi:phosphopantothenoylcysteine synthetase/decarboxylase
MAISFRYKESTLAKNLDSAAERMGAAVLLYAGTKASKIEADMKVNRQWTDQTGAAKANLNASVSQPNPNIVRITLAHGVNYGIWLELAKEKKYAILAPSVRKFAPEVIEDLKGIMGQMK